MIIKSLKQYKKIPSVERILHAFNIPWLRLQTTEVPVTEIYKEYTSLDIKPVYHRPDDVIAGAKHNMWKSLTLYGVDSHITEDVDGEHTWTDVADQCPITVKWIKDNFIINSNTRRIRFMWIGHGGWILPHKDRDDTGLREINVAIKQPTGCIFKFTERGVVPFKDGRSYLIDTSNEHMVFNNSNEPRLHIILHTDMSDEMIQDSYTDTYFDENYNNTIRKAIIIHDCDNDSLLKFTQTKLFFDAKNAGLDFFDDCVTVKSLAEAYDIATNNDTILYTGDFLTTTYRSKHLYAENVHIADQCANTEGHEECVIKFDQDKPINFKKRYYTHPSKQCYIIENMLRTIIHSEKYIYLSNTDLWNSITPIFFQRMPGPGVVKDYSHTFPDMKHFYGLASGFKTVNHVLKNNYDSVTVYDKNKKQLEFAKMLHSYEVLPKELDYIENSIGTYDPSLYVRNNWSKWHNMDVKFELIDLLDEETIRFKPQSIVWCSNIFHYEPTLFLYGYDYMKDKLKELTEVNLNCIMITGDPTGNVTDPTTRASRAGTIIEATGK